MPCLFNASLLNQMLDQFVQMILLIAFNYKNLHNLRYMSIIGILLMTKVFVLTLFSSQILSITIENPYVTIDSIEELKSRPNLEPLLFVRESSIPYMQVNQ